MHKLFAGHIDFNQDLLKWDVHVSRVTDMRFMFLKACAFTTDLQTVLASIEMGCIPSLQNTKLKFRDV